MWRAKQVTAVLQRLRRDTRHRGVLVGAAFSLFLVHQLDQQSRRDELSIADSVRWMLGSSVAECKARGAEELARRLTARVDQVSLKTQYNVRWDAPLGEGAFGAVYLAVDKKTGEKVAIKKIDKRYTNDDSFQREMNALLHLRKSGGHPNICSLREHFDEGGYYYLVLDLIQGGEMFEHLVKQGPYSEADAARLVREVASALAFIHGLDTVHADIKPENLMLSTDNPSDAVIKLVDFGCAQVDASDSMFAGVDENSLAAKTPAYCPPEVLDSKSSEPYEPSMDIWALGVVLYVMLTGRHPYDLTGKATDEEIEALVVSRKPPPLRGSPITKHLSPSAVDLIEKLLATDPKKRITALQMLEHPWVKGETASRSKIADSDKKLSTYRAYKSKIQAKVFSDIVSWADQSDDKENSPKTSLIERSFKLFDEASKGFITHDDLQKMTTKRPNEAATPDSSPDDSAPLSLSGFSSLLSENMKNKYYPKGHTIYMQGDIGNHMYIINSGVVEVRTKDGSVAKRGPGNFFGEGALFHPSKRRSATTKCLTPVHLFEISREYFEKYLADSDPGLLFTLREKDKIRKRNRARTVMRMQKNLVLREYEKGDKLFSEGDSSWFGNYSVFLVEEGTFDVSVEGCNVFSALPGNFCGEYSVLTRKPRNVTAVCASDTGCKAFEMRGRDLRRLMKTSPEIEWSLTELRVRRDFKKAVVKRLNREFPYDNPRLAFEAVRSKDCPPNEISKEAFRAVLLELNPKYTEKELDEVLDAVDLSGTGSVSYEEFKKVFIADKKRSAAM